MGEATEMVIDDEATSGATSGATPSESPSGTTTADRRCGRCQLLFAGDPSAHPTALAAWWLCPPCNQSLLGRSRPGG